jgi:hypothetical protein
MQGLRVSFVDFPTCIIKGWKKFVDLWFFFFFFPKKDVNMKSTGRTGLVCNIDGLGDCSIVQCSFSLQRLSNSMLEDCSNYLDERMYTLESNKMISGPGDVTQVYLVRKVSNWSEKKSWLFFPSKIKIGMWAKTSKREDTEFFFRCVFKLSDGRLAEAVSPSFRIYSHQSQLGLDSTKKKKTIHKRENSSPSLKIAVTPNVEHQEHQEVVFGLSSLFDAALEASDNESSATRHKKVLLKRADDLALEIYDLQHEECVLRRQAEGLKD